MGSTIEERVPFFHLSVTNAPTLYVQCCLDDK